MKKIFTLVMLLLIYCSIAAQEFRGGIEAGVNLSRPICDETESGSTGFYLGGKCEMAFKSFDKGWIIDGAMHLSSKPYQGKIDRIPLWGDGSEYGYFEKYSNIPYYLEFPFHIGYKFNIHKDVTLTPAIGPYVAIGLFGKSKLVEMNGECDILNTHNLHNPFEEKQYGNHRFDAGITCSLGAEFFQHFQLNLGYNLGLDNSYERYNSVFSIGAAWMF